MLTYLQLLTLDVLGNLTSYRLTKSIYSVLQVKMFLCFIKGTEAWGWVGDNVRSKVI